MKKNKAVAAALTAAIIVSGGGIATSVVSATPAQAATTQTQLDAAINQILNDTNAARAANGLPPLALTPGINTVAQNWSAQMAATKTMMHNPDYQFQMPAGWSRAGENVAQGYTPSTVVNAWMNSEGHRANILGDYTNIGIGYVVDETGRGWFTQNFGKYNVATAPTGITEPVTSSTPSSITANWSAKPGEAVTYYTTKLYTPDGVLLKTTTSSEPSVTFEGLNESTSYNIEVTATDVDALGASYTSPATTFSVTTTANLPAVSEPTNLYLSSTENSVAAYWGAPAQVTGALQPYHVELRKSDGTIVQTADTSDTSYVFNGLASNSEYIVTVVATTVVNGQSAQAATTIGVSTDLSSAASVSNVTDLYAVSPDYSTIHVTWAAPATQVGVGLEYQVTLHTAGKPDVSYTTNDLGYSFNGLTSDTNYTITVTSVIHSENGANIATSPGISTNAKTLLDMSAVSVSAPQNLDVQTKANEATLTWAAPATVEGTLNNYTVTVKHVGEADRVFTTNSTSFTVPGLAENSSYVFEVKADAVSLDGYRHATSEIVSVTAKTPYSPSTIIVSAPQNITASASEGRVNVSWNAPATLVGNLAGYKVTLKELGQFGTSTVVSSQTTTDLNISFTGLKDDTSYVAEVSALATSPDGTNNKVSDVVTVSAKTPVIVAAPNAPVGLTTANLTYTDTMLYWSVPTGVVGNIATYTVTVKQNGKPDRVFTTNQTGVYVSGLTENTNYSATVVANVVSLQGMKTATSPAASLYFSTPKNPTPTIVTVPPTNLVLSDVTSDSIKASWSRANGPVLGYRLTVKQAGLVTVGIYDTTDTSFTIPGLVDGISYTIEVASEGFPLNGQRVWSMPIAATAVTPQKPVVVPTPDPTPTPTPTETAPEPTTPPVVTPTPTPTTPANPAPTPTVPPVVVPPVVVPPVVVPPVVVPPVVVPPVTPAPVVPAPKPATPAPAKTESPVVISAPAPVAQDGTQKDEEITFPDFTQFFPQAPETTQDSEKKDDTVKSNEENLKRYFLSKDTISKALAKLLSAGKVAHASAPAKVEVKAGGSTLNTSWEAPATIGKVTHYTVTIRDGYKIVENFTTNDPNATIYGLKSKTTYTVQVKTHVESADGTEKSYSTSIKKITTK